jgi:hypothetical protein
MPPEDGLRIETCSGSKDRGQNCCSDGNIITKLYTRNRKQITTVTITREAICLNLVTHAEPYLHDLYMQQWCVVSPHGNGCSDLLQCNVLYAVMKALLFRNLNAISTTEQRPLIC